MTKNKPTFKCHNCGKEYPWTVAQEQETKQRGNTRHICPACAKVKAKGTKYTKPAHTTKEHGFFIQFTMQGKPYSQTAYNSMISEVYQFLPTEKNGKQIQFNSPVYNSGCGLKKVFRSFSEFCDFSDKGASHKITVGNRHYLTGEVMQAMRDNYKELFGQLMDEMSASPADCEKVFGRKFFAANWLDLSANDRITLNICKFVDANQYYQLSEMAREFIECICTNWLEYGMDAHKATVTSGKLAKIFTKYANGKAHCQRASRNSKAA